MGQDRDARRRSATEDGSVDGSLDAALDNLESFIERRRPDSSAASDEHDHSASGPSAGAAVDAVPERRPFEVSASACHRIAERLASEVEVIVNARLESAVRDALADARREVRNHVAIVLPELLEDILNDDELP